MTDERKAPDIVELAGMLDRATATLRQNTLSMVDYANRARDAEAALAGRFSDIPAIKALLDYCAEAPDQECGEGFWDDMESACGDGARSERSIAAIKMREALKVLGIDPPAGVPVCDECYCELDCGHHSQCSRGGEDEEA